MQGSKPHTPINWLSLSTITFSISFVLGLWGFRDVGQAFLGGLLSVPGSLVGITITHKRRFHQDKRLRQLLLRQIQDLQLHQEQAHQDLVEKVATQRTIEANIQSLREEHDQAIQHVSALYYQRNELYHEVNSFYHHQQQQENKTEQYEKRQQELRQVLSAKTVEIHQAKTELATLQLEFKQVQDLIRESQQKQAEFQQVILDISEQKQALEESIQSLTQTKQDITQGLANLENQPQAGNDSLQSPEAESMDEEWLVFIRQLSQEDRQVILTILNQDPEGLKKIADENTTMPRLLVDRINENSLKILSDMLLIHGIDGELPEINEEYLDLFDKPIQFYLKDLLQVDI